MFFKKREQEMVACDHQKELHEELHEELAGKMEMKQYISFDDVRKHLVEMIEENKKLREENESLRKSRYDTSERERKRAELAQISADEYKSRLAETEKIVDKLKKELEETQRKLEYAEKLKNEAVVELEMKKTKRRTKTTEEEPNE